MLRSEVLRSCTVALALALASAGCGGDDETADPATTSTSAPTTTTTASAVEKADYIAEANAICQEMNDAVAALGNPDSDPTAFADVVDEGVRIISDALVTLRARPAPVEDAATLDAIWSQVDVLIADFTALSAALRAGDLDRAEQLSEAADASQAAANEAAIEYGLTVCGS